MESLFQQTPLKHTVPQVVAVKHNLIFRYRSTGVFRSGVVGNEGRLGVRQFGERARAGIAEVRSGGRGKVGNGCTGKVGAAGWLPSRGRTVVAGEKIGQIWLENLILYYRNMGVKNVQIYMEAFTQPQAYSLPAHIREGKITLSYMSNIYQKSFRINIILWRWGAFPFFYAPFIFLCYSEC